MLCPHRLSPHSPYVMGHRRIAHRSRGDISISRALSQFLYMHHTRTHDVHHSPGMKCKDFLGGKGGQEESLSRYLQKRASLDPSCSTHKAYLGLSAVA